MGTEKDGFHRRSIGGDFWEIKGFEFRKCFKASYGFYDAPRGRDFSYFGFIHPYGLILGLIVGWFYIVFMACFMPCL